MTKQSVSGAILFLIPRKFDEFVAFFSDAPYCKPGQVQVFGVACNETAIICISKVMLELSNLSCFHMTIYYLNDKNRSDDELGVTLIFRVAHDKTACIGCNFIPDTQTI